MSKNQSIEIQRFKEVREENRYTQSELAEILGVKNSTADIERGKTKLSGKVVSGLLKTFNINPLWLFGESEVKYAQATKPDVLPKTITVNSNGYENMLLVNQKAAAGYPQNIGDVEWHRQLPAFDMPLPQYRNATYRGFQIEGDSMLPNFQPEDWVLGKAVSNLDEINDNKVYVVVTSDSVVVKKVRKIPGEARLLLISLNENYPPFELKFNEIRELWQVNSKLTFNLDSISENGILRQLQESMEELKAQLTPSLKIK